MRNLVYHTPQNMLQYKQLTYYAKAIQNLILLQCFIIFFNLFLKKHPSIAAIFNPSVITFTRSKSDVKSLIQSITY